MNWDTDAGNLVAQLVPAICVWREASGDGAAGMLGVAMVIRNRMRTRQMAASQVCLQKWQFSSMNAPNDPGMLHWPGPNDSSFLVAYQQWLASASVTPELDPTRGAEYYYALTIQMPSWASSYTLTATIGNQRFYRA